MIRLLILIVTLLLLSPIASSKNIFITHTGNGTIYQDIAEALRAKLIANHPTDTHQIIATTYKELKLLSPKKKDLIVGINPPQPRLQSLKKYPSDILFTFIRGNNIDKKDYNSKQWSIVNIDQPINILEKKATKLIKSNYKKNILVILSEEQKNKTLDIEKLKRSNDTKIKIITIKKNDIAAKVIEAELYNTGVIIAVPDQKIWSGNSARWLLQQAYNFKVPVIGYSKNFLKAGAMISVYSTAEQINDETEKQIEQWMQSGKLNKKISYPEFNIEINKNIAKALNYNDLDVSELGGKQ